MAHRPSNQSRPEVAFRSAQTCEPDYRQRISWSRAWAFCALIVACSISASAPAVEKARERASTSSGSLLPSLNEPLGWIGEHEDADTGLKYLNARYYDPVLGTFLSPDDWHPAAAGVGPNRYGYGFGDPINNVDPSGHLSDCLKYHHVVSEIGADGAMATVEEVCVSTWGGRSGSSEPSWSYPPEPGRGPIEDDPYDPAAPQRGGTSHGGDDTPTPRPSPRSWPDWWPWFSKPSEEPLVQQPTSTLPKARGLESGAPDEAPPAKLRPDRALKSSPVHDAIAPQAQAAAAMSLGSPVLVSPSGPMHEPSASPRMGTMTPSQWFRAYGGPMAATIRDHDR